MNHEDRFPDGKFAMAKESFLFSVNRQKAYPVRDPTQAMYCLKDWGPAFGLTDLAITDLGLTDLGPFVEHYDNGFSRLKYYDCKDVRDPDTELMGTRHSICCCALNP